jgi:hypothetical protein
VWICASTPQYAFMAWCSVRGSTGTTLSLNVQNMNELRGRIVKAAECVTNEMLTSTWRQTGYRLDVCRAINGAHIEIC